MRDNDVVRVTRILTYEGPRKWVETTLDNPSAFVPRVGRKEVVTRDSAEWNKNGASAFIRSIVVGEPQLVPPRAPTPTPADAVVAVLERAKDGRP